MAFYRTLGPITFTNGNTVVAYKEPGLVVWLTEEQADELAGLIEEVDAHHAPPNSPPLGTPSGGNLGNCVGYPSSQLVGLLDNAQLAHKAITVCGTDVELGGSITRDQITGMGSNGLVKRSGANTYQPAVAGTDFQAPLQSPVLNTQTVKTAHYTAAASELVPVSASSGAINVTLPTAPVDGTRVAVKKIDSSANVVNILTGGSDVINESGVTSLSLSAKYQVAVLQYFAASTVWYVVSTDVSTTAAGKVDKDSLVVNVKDHGAVGDGSTDDASAINACINAAAAGSTIFFPASTYAITAPLVLRPDLKYVGGGHAHSGTAAVIKQKNSANITNGAGLTGLAVANAWYTNAAFCDNPIRIENLRFDGNKANNASSTACGVVLTSYRSWIVDCEIINTPKDGIRLTDTTANGSNVVGNSCVENRILNCHIDNVGGDGVRNISGNGNSNTDGYLIDCIISNVTGSGINLGRAAGWQIRSNHLYTIGVHGIVADKSYGAVIADNYVEDFGGQATAAAYYAGIAVTQLDGRQSSVTGNYVGCYESSASVGGYQYIVISSAYGTTDSHVVNSGNKIHGPASPTNKGIAFIYVASGGGGRSVIYDTSNDVVNVNSPLYNDGSALVRSSNQAKLFTETYTPQGSASDFANIQAIIDTWAATNLPGVIRIAAGTATLSSTGTNLPGALRIPANKPSLIIEGSGEDATKFQLSRSVPRLFDLYGTGSGNAFNNITLRNFSLDGNNVSYTSIATGVTVTSDTTLVAGQFTAVPVNSNTPFVNAGTNWCSAPTSNTGTSAGSFMLYSLTGGTTINLYNATGSNKTIKSGDSLTGYLYDHVLFGNMHVGSTSGTGQSVSGIRLENITVTNVPTLATSGLTAYTPSIRFGIYIQPGAGGSVTDVVCRNVRIYGGECGFYVVGNFGTFMDNIVLDSCLHDTGIVPTYAYASANYVIGFNSWVNRVDVRNCRGYGSGDVGLEIDQPISASATGCRMFNAYDANFYVTNFAPPADSISGPPTATLSGSINSSVTSATINAFPTTLAHEGYAVIDSEIVAYSRASSTSLTLIRGLDSSTAASHSSGATVTFVQARRQSMKFIDCQAINTGPAGIGWWYNTNSFLPIPAIDMNNCTVTNTVTDLTKSAGVMATGNIVGCTMVDCNIIANLNNTTSQAVAYSPVFLRRPGLSGATTAQNNAADVLFRNTKVTMSGSVASSSANLYGAWLADGWWNVAGDLTVRNNAVGPAAGGTGGMFISGTSQLAYIQQARPLIIFESTSSSDSIPQVFYMSAASIMDRVDLSLDLSQAYMSTNQLPWNIPSGLRDQFFVKDVAPPRLATGGNASNPAKIKDVTATPYSARLADRVDRINVASASVVNLPATNTGNALAIPRPGAGALKTVKDVSGAAATYPITINAAGGETIDGAASVVINRNYGHIELVSNGTGWNVIGSGPNPPAVFEATDQGYIAWAFDPALSYNGNAPTAGLVYVTAVPVRRSGTVTNVINCVGVAGSGLTSGQNFAALYNSAGTLLSQTADQTTAWASTGIKTMALAAAQAVTPGIYYVAMWSNGTTPPKFLETITTVYGGALINGTPVRFGTANASVTTTAPGTLSGPTAGAIGFWAALS